MEEFSKGYANEEEYSYRKAVFEDNYKAIVDWNSYQTVAFRQKATVWTDHTLAELGTTQ